MKKYFILLLLAAVGIGCRSNNATPEESVIPQLSEADFLKNDTPIFQGNLGPDFVSWQSGKQAGMFSLGMGTAFRNGGSNRIVDFDLSFNRGREPRIRVATPQYQLGATQDLERIFSVGKKDIGNYSENFHINLGLNGKNYETTKEGGGSIEILKTAITSNQLRTNVLRVWFKIDATLYEKPSNTNPIQIKNGLMTADFVPYEP